MNSIFKGFDLKALLGKLEKYKYVLLVVLIGVVLMLLPTNSSKSGTDTQNTEQADDGAATESFSLTAFENRLEDILSQIDGAGETRVALTLKAGAETILAEQTESSPDREVVQVVTVNQGSGYQEPVVTKTIYPQFQGALIVCRGGGSASVRLQIVNAVASLTGLGSDKITVVKMKN